MTHPQVLTLASWHWLHAARIRGGLPVPVAGWLQLCESSVSQVLCVDDEQSDSTFFLNYLACHGCDLVVGTGGFWECVHYLIERHRLERDYVELLYRCPELISVLPASPPRQEIYSSASC